MIVGDVGGYRKSMQIMGVNMWNMLSSHIAKFGAWRMETNIFRRWMVNPPSYLVRYNLIRWYFCIPKMKQNHLPQASTASTRPWTYLFRHRPATSDHLLQGPCQVRAVKASAQHLTHIALPVLVAALPISAVPITVFSEPLAPNSVLARILVEIFALAPFGHTWIVCPISIAKVTRRILLVVTLLFVKRFLRCVRIIWPGSKTKHTWMCRIFGSPQWHATPWAKCTLTHLDAPCKK